MTIKMVQVTHPQTSTQVRTVISSKSLFYILLRQKITIYSILRRGMAKF